MKVVFVSNYYNHHQAALCRALNERVERFTFVSTSEMRQDRRVLGYGMSQIPTYVEEAHKGEAQSAACEAKIAEAGAVIFGSAPERMITRHVRAGGLTFRYSERPCKTGVGLLEKAKRYLIWHLRNPRKKNVYLLCAGAYTASDYAAYGLFGGKMYKWGYFPETKKYESMERLLSQKDKKLLVWAGRLISWKHPDMVLRMAKRLKESGYAFSLRMIGSGLMEESLRQMIRELDLEDCVSLLGSMKPEEVRVQMEQAGIFLATSDRQEGWGAVINEAMNSGCAVVASHAMGSVPYLIENENNGLIYKSCDIDALYEKVCVLLDHPQKQNLLGASAYHTIVDVWNAAVAAERLCKLSEAILNSEDPSQLYQSGPCSRAELLSDDWM